MNQAVLGEIPSIQREKSVSAKIQRAPFVNREFENEFPMVRSLIKFIQTKKSEKDAEKQGDFGFIKTGESFYQSALKI
jgi:hypothetical protein